MPVIGNRRSFAFELQPVVPSWERRYAPEQTAWAGTAIWVNGQNLCSHVLDGSREIQDYLYIPLAPIADWLVRSHEAIRFEERAAWFPTTRHVFESAERWIAAQPAAGFGEDEWIDARYDWWSRHFVRAGTEGAVLPELAFVRDDEQFVISWSPARYFGAQDLTFLTGDGEFGVDWTTAEAVLSKFVTLVARWLRDAGVSHLYEWASSEDPLTSAFQSLSESVELLTGRSSTELNELFGVERTDDLFGRLGLTQSTADPAVSPECQILRDLSPSQPREMGDLLLHVGDLVRTDNPEAAAKWRAGRTVALDAARPARTVEEAGYLAAAEIRRELGLDGQPIADTRAVLGKFGLDCEHSPMTTGDRMIVGAQQGGTPIARTLRDQRTETVWGRRFEESRALGHILLDPIRQSVVGAGSGAFAQETRRRRSGAFAAELLLPDAALALASGNRRDGAADDHAFQLLLEQYAVGASTAAHQLFNRGWLSSMDVRDELIDRFSSTAPAYSDG